MASSEIVTIISAGVSLVALVLSIVLKRKSPAISKTLEEISQEALQYGNIKANKYFNKQCKKYKIDVSDKSLDNKECDAINGENIPNNNKIEV